MDLGDRIASGTAIETKPKPELLNNCIYAQNRERPSGASGGS